MLHFDPTVSLGNVLTIISIVVAWRTLQTNTRNRSLEMHTKNETRLTLIETTLESVDTRLQRIEDWLFRKLH